MKKVIGKIILFIIFAWLVVVLVDFFLVTSNKDPLFCINKDTKKYDDGKVDICTGLGYVVYNYQRESLETVEFGPIYFTEEKQPEE